MLFLFSELVYILVFEICTMTKVKLLSVTITAIIVTSIITYISYSQLIPTYAQQPNSDSVRIAVVGDIDCKDTQTKQFDTIKTLNPDLFFSGGDYGYSNGQCVLDNLKDHGFNSTNSAIACGNHDSCNQLKNFLNMSSSIGKKSFFSGKIEAFILKGKETGVNCSDNQFTNIKSLLEGSHAMYKIVLIHQPFATAKSEADGQEAHPPNGGFDCYHALFKDTGVMVVLQAHNHNDQRFVIDNITYTVNGGGHHDEPESMYSIVSDSFKTDTNTYPLLFKDASHNGFLLMDLQINGTNKHIKGKFVTDANESKDSWEVGGIPTPNGTFAVTVGKGNATFVPSNQSNANVTIAVDAGVAILPKP
jgi:hypothetical protein